MRLRRQPARLTCTLALGLGSALYPAVLWPVLYPAAQAQLPATPPTAQPATTAPLSATSTKLTDPRPHRAAVSYADGALEVRADNSSLNGILYEIARATGMKISGGVADQRVFGHYGPAAPSDILATLLDGTGTNMLLKENEGEGPVELVLTPRTGGVAPPSPTAPTDSDADDDRSVPGLPGNVPSLIGRRGPQPGPPPVQVQPGPGSVPPPLNNPLGSPENTTNTVSTMPTTNSVPTDTLPTPSTATETQQGIVDSPNPPPPNSTTGTASTTGANSTTNGTGISSPNGVATPEQIYQQLLKLQQQQNGSTGSGASGTTPTATPPQ